MSGRVHVTTVVVDACVMCHSVSHRRSSVVRRICLHFCMGMLLECASLEAWWKRSAVPYTIPLFSFLLIFSRFFLYFAKTRELVELREWTAIVIFLFMCFAPDHKMTWTSYCQKQELVVMFFWPLRSVHNKHQQIQAWTDKVRSHCPDGEFGSSAW
jgi:hypothetical protein